MTLNSYLIKIQDRAQWKISFSLDWTWQAHEVIFFRKVNKAASPPLVFKSSEVSSSQKDLGLTLYTKLSFNKHINGEIYQANKGIGSLLKLQTYLTHTSLLTIYKSFIRALLDYANMINDQPSNNSFSRKTELVQYNAVLAITGVIKSPFHEKLYQELRLEYVDKRLGRRLCLL